VTAPVACSWAATATQPWIAITQGATGSGTGTISFSTTPNATTAARTGAVAVSSASATITQSGLVANLCPAGSYKLSPSVRSAPAAGTSFTVLFLSDPGCPRQYFSNVPWMSTWVDDSGPIVTVAQNTGPGVRTGTAIFGDQTLTVTQDGTASLACAYAVSPTSVSLNAAGGRGSLQVLTSSMCSWSTEADALGEDWILGRTSGAGPATLTYVVAPNTWGAARSGRLLVYGDSGPGVAASLAVSQAAATCVYSVSPATSSFPGSGGTGSFRVTALPGTCSWSASSSDFIRIQGSTGGTGDGTVSFAVASNPGAQRSGTIVVAGLSGVNPAAVHTVAQAAAGIR
jgi:hypothetical protein